MTNEIKIGDMIEYKLGSQFGFVVGYDEDNDWFGIQWFEYSKVAWYSSKLIFHKVS